MYEMQVEGMTCDHCIRAVTKAVTEVDSGAKIDVDLAAHKVRVDSKASIHDVRSAIAEAGYEVSACKTL